MTWQQEVDIAAELAAQKYRERADKAEKRADAAEAELQGLRHQMSELLKKIEPQSCI